MTIKSTGVKANILLDEAKKVMNPGEALCCPLSPAIGTHVGPGTIALSYMAGGE